jgi:hypothetical protein
MGLICFLPITHPSPRALQLESDDRVNFGQVNSLEPKRTEQTEENTLHTQHGAVW